MAKKTARKKQKNIQTGGIGFAETYRGKNKEAFDFFMTNAASFKILTDSSVSAITLIAELKPDVQSPYIGINPASHNFMASINKVLIKILPSHNLSTKKILAPPGTVKRSELLKEDTMKGFVEINSVHNIESECNIQKNLYRQSIINSSLPFVPICPAVVYIENQVANPHKIQHWLSGKIINRGFHNYIGIAINDEEIINSFLNVTIPPQNQIGGVTPPSPPPLPPPPPPLDLPPPQPLDLPPNEHISPNYEDLVLSEFKPLPDAQIEALFPMPEIPAAAIVENINGNYSIIVMELLDNYDTFENIKKHIIANNAIQGNLKAYFINRMLLLSSIEARRMHLFDYYHNDFHLGNIMINLNDLYATDDPNNNVDKGKAFIIDFGRTLHKSSPKLMKQCASNLNTEACLKNEVIFKTNNILPGVTSLKTVAECNEFAKKMKLTAIKRMSLVCKLLGIPYTPGKSVSRLIIEQLVKSNLIFSGGGKVRKTTHKTTSSANNITTPITEEGLLLGQVILNSLRQTDTFAELNEYLQNYYITHDANAINTNHKTVAAFNNPRRTKKTNIRINRQFLSKLNQRPTIMSYGGGNK